MKDTNHGFVANRWLVHNRFTGLGNPLEVVGHHLLIGGMTGLDYWNEFPMVSALVYIVIHWIVPMVSHDFIKLLHCVISQSWENIELVLKLAVTLTYGWDCKLVIYSLWIRSLLMEANSNRYSLQRHHDISWDWDSASSWTILRRYVHRNYGHDSSLSETWHRLFES